MKASAEIRIQEASEWRHYLRCEDIQKTVWQLPNDRDIVPAHLLKTAHKNGGLLIGAFDRDDMVGFVFGFLGSEGREASRRIKHCSHMLGVLEPYRAIGLGLRLKLAQRDRLIETGLDLATWTFDPLQCVNATLNIGRLGATTKRYIRDAYGNMHDGLNAGLSSDRLEVEWWVSTNHVQTRLSRKSERAEVGSARRILETGFDNDGLLRIESEAEFEGRESFLEVPPNFGSMKLKNLDLAREWRARTRIAFEEAFASRYVAVDFAQIVDRDGRTHVGYILKREEATLI